MRLENVKLISEAEASWIRWEPRRELTYPVRKLYNWYHHEIKTPKAERIPWEEVENMDTYSPQQMILEGKDPRPFSSREEFDRAVQMAHGDNWLYVYDGRRRSMSKLQQTIDTTPLSISSENPVAFMVRGYFNEPERGCLYGVRIPAVLYLAFPFRYENDTEIARGIEIEPGAIKRREYEHDFGHVKVFLDLHEVDMGSSATMNRRIARSGYPIIRWYNEAY